MPSTIKSAVLYRHGGRYGVTREGAVLASQPFCRDENETRHAVPYGVTDDGHGGDAAIGALGLVLELGALDPVKYLPVFNALVDGKFATAVEEGERLGLLK